MDKKYTDAIEICPNCNNKNFKIKTCTAKCNIQSFPNYLIFIIVINNEELSTLPEFLLNIIKENINIINNEFNYTYSYISCISCIC